MRMIHANVQWSFYPCTNKGYVRMKYKQIKKDIDNGGEFCLSEKKKVSY